MRHALPGALAFWQACRHIPGMMLRKYLSSTPMPALARPAIRGRAAQLATVLAIGVVMGACEPTVKLAAPDKPIVINLNVKIEREVRVKVEREIEDLIRENKEIF